MEFVRKHRLIILFIVLPSLAWLFTNAVINRHYHYVNGYITTHSHPYNKHSGDGTQFPTHHHGENEIILIDQFSHPEIIFFGLLAINLIITLLGKVQSSYVFNLPLAVSFCLPSYRAPPFYMQ
jgi:4-amino-4-deoxy-L-arabinose transferase-like glycosyltransferase